MRDNQPLRRWAPIVVTCAIAGLAAACAGAPPEPRTDAERLTLGKQVVDRMSTKLASAQTFSVKTREVRHVNTRRASPERTRSIVKPSSAARIVSTP